MDAPSDFTPNDAFGEANACLHCLVWDVIHANSPKDPTGQALYDAQAIIAGLSEILAEIFASHPRNQRRILLAHFEKDLRGYVARKAASGQFPKGRPASPGGRVH